MDHLLINARPRVSHNVILHVRRTLTGSSVKILVEVGQEVKPADIIAEGQTSGGFRSLPLAEELKVEAKEVPLYLRRQTGQMIYKGELLAFREGFLGFRKKEIISPVDGVLEYFDQDQGNLRIKLLPQRKQLASGVYGVVDRVSRSLGIVVIRTMADLIFGLCGSGQERGGMIRVAGLGSSLVSARQVGSDFAGQIIVGGSLVTKDALEKAIELRAGGFITGGINAGDYRKISGGKDALSRARWADIGLSVLVTEGFGSAVLGDDIQQVLKRHEGQFALINGNQARVVLPSANADSMIYIRKTNLLETALAGCAPAVAVTELKVGMTARVVSAPFFGHQGIVRSIDRAQTKLPSGVVTYMVIVDTPLRKMRVPYLNIEAICQG